jgi:hypothetical protein
MQASSKLTHITTVRLVQIVDTSKCHLPGESCQEFEMTASPSSKIFVKALGRQGDVSEEQEEEEVPGSSSVSTTLELSSCFCDQNLSKHSIDKSKVLFTPKQKIVYSFKARGSNPHGEDQARSHELTLFFFCRQTRLRLSWFRRSGHTCI